MISRVADERHEGASPGHQTNAWTPHSPFDERAGGPRDEVLDGLRAVAVLAVVAGHAALYRFGVVQNALALQVTKLLSLMAMTGVWIFFLISGYVITRLLLIEYCERGSISLAKFYTRRITRIIPPFVIYLGVTLMISRTGYFVVPLGDIAAGGLFMCNITAQQCNWFVGHTWSLAVEEQFYLLWPMLLMIVTPRWLPHFLTAVILALLIVAQYRNVGYLGNEISFLFIVCGALVASSAWMQRLILSWVSAPIWIGAAGALVVASLFAPDAAKLVLRPSLLAILVFGAANIAAPSMLLRSRIFQVVGGCSYSLYLWQQLFLAAPAYYFGFLPPLWALPVVVWVSWRFVEKPGMALGRAWTRSAAATANAETRFS